MFWNIVIGIASFLLNLVLAPKPQNAKPSSLADFSIPVAEEGLEIPVAFGTNWFKGMNVVWYGNLLIYDIKGKRRYGFFGPRQVIGHRYTIGLHAILCHSSHDKVHKIIAGDKQIFPKLPDVEPLEGQGTILIDQLEIFGGDEREGGISGLVHVLPGIANQGVSPYLATHLGHGAETPEFRGVVSIIWENLYIGTNTYIKPWEILLQRIHLTSAGAEQWYDAKAAVPESQTAPISEPGYEFLSGATMNEHDQLDINGMYAAYAESDILRVMNNSTGIIQTYNFIPVGLGGYGGAGKVHLTDYGETVTRCGGNIFGSADTRLEFRQVSDIDTVLQTINLDPIFDDLGLLEINFGCIIGEHDGWMLVKMGPSVYENQPWVLLERGVSTWSVDSYHAGENWPSDTITLNSISMGPTYAYCAVSYPSSGSTKVVRVTWDNGSWDEQLIDLTAGTGGNVVRAIHYFEGTGEVVVLCSGRILVYNEDLSTLLRSSTGNGSGFGTITNSKRMAFSNSTVVVANATGPGAITTIFTVRVSDLQVDKTVTIADTVYINKASPGYTWLLHGRESGGMLVGGHFFKTNFWPLRFPDALDMNPAHIIRECITDPIWGMGYADADMDDDSFIAAADTLFDECFGLSYLWAQEEELREFITMVLSTIGAYCYLRRDTGKWYLKLTRNDYDVEDLPVFTEDDVIKWENINHRLPGEAVSSVTVKFTDRSRRGKDGAVSWDNIAQENMIGQKIGSTVYYPGVQRGSLASRLSLRDQRSLGVGMIDGRVQAKRTMAKLYPGDVFRLVSDRHQLDGQIMRVAGIRFDDGKTNKVGVKFVQDIFHLNEQELVDTTPPDFEVPTNPPSAVLLRMVIESPFYLLYQFSGPSDAATILTTNPSNGALALSGVQPTGDSLNAAIWVDSADALTSMPFVPGGYLQDAIFPFDTLLVISDPTNVSLIEVGMIAVIVDQTNPTDPDLMEFVRITANASGYLTIDRGLLDTVPKSHNAGDFLIVFDEDSTTDYELRTSSFVPVVEMLTRTGTEMLSAADAPDDTVVFNSRAIRPLPPANVTINGLSEGPIDATGTAYLLIEWVNRNRLTQVTKSAVTDWNDTFSDEEDGQSAIIEVRDPTNAIIYTSSPLSGTSVSLDIVTAFGGNSSGWVRVGSIRDGHREWQAFPFLVLVSVESLVLDLDDLVLDGETLILGA